MANKYWELEIHAEDELKKKMENWTSAQLIEYILFLKEHRAFKNEDRLKLQILDWVDFTIWACDKNHKIVLWDGKCEQNYKISKNEAIGKNYLYLIVKDIERRQSEIDCDKIINTGEPQHFRLCEDEDSRGMPLQIITQCCRIYNDDDEPLQAEMAIYIDFDKLKRESDEFLEKEKRENDEIEAASYELISACNNIMERLATKADEKMNYFLGIQTPDRTSPTSAIKAMTKISEIRRSYTEYFRNQREYFKTNVVGCEAQENFTGNHSFEYDYRINKHVFIEHRKQLDQMEIEFLNKLFDIAIESVGSDTLS